MEGSERNGKKSGHRRSWSDLPPEMLSEIGKRLSTRLEVVRFRSVCNSWRFSLSSDHRFPLKIPCAPDLSPYCWFFGPGSFMVIETTVYSIQPKDPNPNCGGKCGKIGFDHFLPSDARGSSTLRLAALDEVHPQRFIAGQVFIPFGHPTFAKVINLLDDVSVSSISKFYRIMFAHLKGGGEEVAGEEKKGGKGTSFYDRFKLYLGCFEVVDKVVILSEYSYMNNDGDDVIVAALSSRGLVGLFRLFGSGNTPDPMGWRVVDHEDGKGLRFDDIVNLKGKLYVIDCKGAAFLVDSDSLKLTQLAPPPPVGHLQDTEFHMRRKRLLEASGVLYLLAPCQEQVRGVLQAQVKVYKLRVQIRNWVQVDSLGDQAFFVGSDFSFSTPARDIFSKLACEGNCIFLDQRSFPTYDCYINKRFTPLFEELARGEIGVFYLSDGTKIRLASVSNCPEILCDPPCCLCYM